MTKEEKNKYENEKKEMKKKPYPDTFANTH